MPFENSIEYSNDVSDDVLFADIQPNFTEENTMQVPDGSKADDNTPWVGGTPADEADIPVSELDEAYIPEPELPEAE